jgi:tripartite-type tricarboxylate transporter receptor subunit TctC
VVLSLSTIRQPIQQDVGYEGVMDFTWIASLAEINFGILVPSDSPFHTWKDLVHWAKANPKKATYGCPSGLGNSAHLFGAEIAAQEKTDWLPVPYRASNDCMSALLAGQLTFAIDTLISAAPQERAGKVRLLAVATSERSKLWPRVPTTKELGYDLLIESPIGIGGPAGMKPEVVQTLQDAFKFATEQPAFLQVLDSGALRPRYMSAPEFRKFAEQAAKDQRTLLAKYGFAKKT